MACVIIRLDGESRIFPTIRTLRATAVISIEPNPRYELFCPAALFMCPIRTTAQPYSSAILPSLDITGRISLALCISTLAPIYACIGSRIISLAPVCCIAFSIRSSVIDSSSLLSSMTRTLAQSAFTASSRGLIVSASPSSAV